MLNLIPLLRANSQTEGELGDTEDSEADSDLTQAMRLDGFASEREVPYAFCAVWVSDDELGCSLRNSAQLRLSLSCCSS